MLRWRSRWNKKSNTWMSSVKYRQYKNCLFSATSTRMKFRRRTRTSSEWGSKSLWTSSQIQNIKKSSFRIIKSKQKLETNSKRKFLVIWTTMKKCITKLNNISNGPSRIRTLKIKRMRCSNSFIGTPLLPKRFLRFRLRTKWPENSMKTLTRITKQMIILAIWIFLTLGLRNSNMISFSSMKKELKSLLKKLETSRMFKSKNKNKIFSMKLFENLKSIKLLKQYQKLMNGKWWKRIFRTN